MSFFQIRSPFFSNKPIPSQDFVLTVSGPELIAYQNRLDLNRYTPTITGPVDQFSGASVQQTYLFPPNQPEFNSYTSKSNQNRYVVEVTKQINDGANIQAWFIYPVSQPQFKYYVPDINRWLATDGVGPVRQFAGVTVQQTYIFSQNQPELRYAFPDINRYLNEGPQQILDNTVVATPQTYIFGVYQPDRNMMSLVRSQNGVFTILDSVVVPPSLKKYYTGQFHTTKALLTRGVGF